MYIMIRPHVHHAVILVSSSWCASLIFKPTNLFPPVNEIPSSFQVFAMDIPLHLCDRRKAFYDIQERAIIDQYKQQYLEAGSAEGRKMVATTGILPKLFEYWQEQGKDLSDDEVCFKLTVVCILNDPTSYPPIHDGLRSWLPGSGTIGGWGREREEIRRHPSSMSNDRMWYGCT